MSQTLPEMPLYLLFAAMIAMTLLRYVVMAGVLFAAFWIAGIHVLAARKIQRRALSFAAVRREVTWSLVTALVFALLGLLLRGARDAGWTQLYFDVEERGVLWLVVSVPLLLVLHDAYFYWTHRLMHATPGIFRRFHLVHHLSHDPTPLAMYSFHPLEAAVEFAFLPLVMVLLPLHPHALLAWVLSSSAINALGHLGFELLPAGFTRHWFWGHLNTATHHNLHHSATRSNFALYFTFWDRVMGTMHPRYHEAFEERARAPYVQGRALERPADA